MPSVDLVVDAGDGRRGTVNGMQIIQVPEPLLEGDIDGDGEVDFAESSILADNFTGTITAVALEVSDEGNVHLEINVDTGAMTLEASNTSLAGYSIRSPD